jgi:hypothetical protein
MMIASFGVICSLPDRLPAAMVVENILAGGIEDGKHVKNALGHLTDMSHINFVN